MIESILIAEEFSKLDTAYNSKKQEINELTNAQIFSGVTSKMWVNNHPSGCKRHQLLFSTHNIIPNYCFNCFKIHITVKNVEDLFKLTFLFKGLNLPEDNTRKCMLVSNPNDEHHYAGYIYFQSYKKALSVFHEVSKLIANEICPKALIRIKRGCSNFESRYPDYGKFNSLFVKFVEKNNLSFSIRENEFNISKLAESLEKTKLKHFPEKKFTNVDYAIMKKWLEYAKTIGDDSYKRIFNKELKKISSLDHSKFPSII